MKLKELVKDETQILDLETDKLALHILNCLADQSSSCIKRRGLSTAFLRDYPREKAPDSLYALEEALIWLEHEQMIGPDPTDPEMIFVTRRGKSSLYARLQSPFV